MGLALLPLEIADRRPEPRRIVTKEPKPLVARVAQDAANALRDMAVIDAQSLSVATDRTFALSHELLVLVQRDAVSRLGLMGSHALLIGSDPLSVLGLLALLVSGVIRRALGARACLAPAGPFPNSVVVLTGLHLPALRTPD